MTEFYYNWIVVLVVFIRIQVRCLFTYTFMGEDLEFNMYICSIALILFWWRFGGVFCVCLGLFLCIIAAVLYC